MLEAVILRAFRRDDDFHARVEAGFGASIDSAIRGRIDGARTLPDPAFRSAALNLSAALVLDERLRRHMQEQQGAIITRILAESSSPRGALLAYLAVEGLKFLEHLDFHQFEEAERTRILDEIGRLAQTDTSRPADGKE